MRKNLKVGIGHDFSGNRGGLRNRDRRYIQIKAQGAGYFSDGSHLAVWVRYFGRGRELPGAERRPGLGGEFGQGEVACLSVQIRDIQG